MKCAKCAISVSSDQGTSAHPLHKCNGAPTSETVTHRYPGACLTQELQASFTTTSCRYIKINERLLCLLRSLSMECEGSEHLLLATKLAIPLTNRKKIVPRPRLYSQLEAGALRPLTLITAPAGFGKTTLIGEWLRQCDIPVAWISLESSDNDPVRF